MLKENVYLASETPRVKWAERTARMKRGSWTVAVARVTVSIPGTGQSHIRGLTLCLTC